MFHIWQRSVVPGFDELFREAARLAEKDGLDPWTNPYEEPAYAFEDDVKQELLAQGYPE